ncbi:SOS response-associated peptidase [Propionicimonas sp.]|uniref:SOS response-associated peptidase n=1 Tax=Propionicimonas sp. TaxID=1955623 RepID=UPI0017A07A67|nr:SOS response-associated peptidase [Propionicimonas sp.]MBU3977481.1 SOS response-associated peptidase [Actinomycetota bacterium]MBA3021406.1 SOS response-associated peptidase [Propionicimonas sp.]MBU3985991.1 SOS response-associated peptidase [Actinomycetota bacterium]MBU4008776.1 SOS response-associated peptidase [Actinomycetota bacterium]MBU4066074.1 SOS response-associated peptidase [Actinomycetota bacterium]
MCGRFAASSSAEDLVEFFEIDEVAAPLPGPAYNIAPTDPIAAVLERVGSQGRRRLLTSLRWGLVPSWSKDPSGAARLINARAETLAVKPSFRKALAARRCLIPADGYYEWYGHTVGDAKPIKQPYFIRPLAGGPLVMAGLYEFWKAPDGSWLTTATIITTAAADSVGRLHDRMPMVVHPDNWDAWLDPEFVTEPTALLSVPAAGLEFFAVSTAVNKVGNDGPELLTPSSPVVE